MKNKQRELTKTQIIALNKLREMERPEITAMEFSKKYGINYSSIWNRYCEYFKPIIEK